MRRGEPKMSNDDTLEDTVAAERKTNAISAMKEMQEISVSLGNDKMTLEEINTLINECRECSQRRLML
jgi:hypothetical protein